MCSNVSWLKTNKSLLTRNISEDFEYSIMKSGYKGFHEATLDMFSCLLQSVSKTDFLFFRKKSVRDQAMDKNTGENLLLV